MTEALKIKDLSVSYGSVAALSDVSLTVHEGEYLGIIGPNGGGKTTLISAVTSLLRPDSGTVTIFGEEGKNFVRLNIGCPTATLKQGLDRIFEQYKKRFV